MYIENCPIPFHDLFEVVEFLGSLSPQMAVMFDGCKIDGFPLQFVLGRDGLCLGWLYRRADA